MIRGSSIHGVPSGVLDDHAEQGGAGSAGLVLMVASLVRRWQRPARFGSTSTSLHPRSAGQGRDHPARGSPCARRGRNMGTAANARGSGLPVAAETSSLVSVPTPTSWVEGRTHLGSA